MPIPPTDGAAAAVPLLSGRALAGPLPPELPPLPALPLARAAVDRCADRRVDEAWLQARWAEPETRRYAVSRSRILVDTQPALVSLPVADVPEGERYLLGIDERGIVHTAVSTSEPLPGSQSLRRIAPALSDRDGSLAVHAVGLSNWHATHRHCSRCGAATTIGEAGHLRHCPADGSDHFPRTDPAVITLVLDESGRALLARGVGWSPGQYALLAGFVEPGESAEQAVAREVMEEVGLRIHHTSYLGSQPHPYPSSLMIGFVARTRDVEVRLDRTELEDARWVSRDELNQAMRTGDMAFAPSVSIARRMIEDWYGAPIP